MNSVHFYVLLLCLVGKSCLILCGPMDYSPPGPSVLGILKDILEWVAISFFRGSSQPRNWTFISFFGRQILYCWVTSEATKVWTHCDPSSDMHLNYPGPISCTFSSRVSSGCTFVGGGGGCSGWWLDQALISLLSSLGAHHVDWSYNVMTWWEHHLLFTDMRGDIFSLTLKMIYLELKYSYLLGVNISPQLNEIRETLEHNGLFCVFLGEWVTRHPGPCVIRWYSPPASWACFTSSTKILESLLVLAKFLPSLAWILTEKKCIKRTRHTLI